MIYRHKKIGEQHLCFQQQDLVSYEQKPLQRYREISDWIPQNSTRRESAQKITAKGKPDIGLYPFKELLFGANQPKLPKTVHRQLEQPTPEHQTLVEEQVDGL